MTLILDRLLEVVKVHVHQTKCSDLLAIVLTKKKLNDSDENIIPVQ